MKNKQGFTLVELIVAIGLMTMLVMILATILQSAQEMYDLARIRANIEANGKNAIETIEKDMTKLVTLSNDFAHYKFIMRSLPWDTTIDGPETEALRYYGDNNSSSKKDELASPDDQNLNDSCLLSFYASTDVYDNSIDKTVHKVCRIKYFLKRRSKVSISDNETSDRPGAYLIRRIEPFEYRKDENTGIIEFNWDEPNIVEEDICSFVRGVRLWYYERDAELTNTDVKFVEVTQVQDRFGNPLPGENMWDETEKAVIFKMQDDWNTNPDPFEQQHFLPPAIMVELHVVDDTARAYRIIRKVINIPISPVVLPSKPIQ